MYNKLCIKVDVFNDLHDLNDCYTMYYLLQAIDYMEMLIFVIMDGNKQILFEKLKEKNAFWSYSDPGDLNDDLFIEKVMLMLDIDDIDKLFSLYDRGFIRKVWEEKILRHEPYYHGLNRFFAWFYFDIENPDEFFNQRKIYLP